MKVIFLDVDGELTYSDYSNEKTADIDIEKVKLLKQICDETNAKVVISSSWRGFGDYVPKIYNTLINILTDNNIEVIGKTPYIPSETDNSVSSLVSQTTTEELPYFKLIVGTGRGAEIQEYLDNHSEIDRFVILDDEDWNWCDYGFEEYWIQPTWFGDGGLKPEHVKKAINILNRESD